MAHVVTDNCQACKFTDCVLVCPVDCFYELEDQLIIDPEECIDCSACVAECPVEAIYAEDELPEGSEGALLFNASEAEKLRERGSGPLTEQKEPLATAESRSKELGF